MNAPFGFVLFHSTNKGVFPIGCFRKTAETVNEVNIPVILVMRMFFNHILLC